MRAWIRLAVLGLIAGAIGLPAMGQPLAGVEILGWVRFADIEEEWKRTTDVLHAAGAVVTDTDTLSADELSALLRAVDILLIPEQEIGLEDRDLIPAGEKLAPAFLEFLRDGGLIVSLDYWDGGVDLLGAAGLTSADDDYSITGEDLRVVQPEDPLARGVAATFEAPSGTTDYAMVDKDAQVIVASEAGTPVVFWLERHGGQILFLGFDFHRANDATKALLVNACTPRLLPGTQLYSGVPYQGSLAVGRRTELPEEQYYLSVPADAGHVLVQLDANLHLHLRGGRPVEFVGQQVTADLSLLGPGPKLALVPAPILASRHWHFALGNVDDVEQVYTLVAWVIPTVTKVAETPFAERARVEFPAIDALDAFLRTEEGYLGLVQYKVEVVKTPGMLSLVLRSEKGVRGWVRYGEPVKVAGGKVVADFAFRDAFTLMGPWLKPGTYYVAIEGLNLPQEYELTVELR